MSISEQDLGTAPGVVTPTDVPTEVGRAAWAEDTRRVLTRGLLVRASLAAPGEAQALRFRALHLNLPLVVAVAQRLELTDAERLRTEHAALDGLHEAVHLFDPYRDAEFSFFATAFVEWRVRTALRRGRHPIRRGRLAVVPRISRRSARPKRR